MLAGAMVVTMAAPGVPAYAVQFEEEVTLKFDPTNGPGIKDSSYKDAIWPGGGEGGRPANLVNGVFVATGGAGTPLRVSQDFQGIPTETVGSGPRPLLPDFNGITWDGFSFAGWYGEDGSRIHYI